MDNSHFQVLEVFQERTRHLNTDWISTPAIDRFVMQRHPELVFDGKLGSILKDLINEAYIVFENKRGYGLTDKGKNVGDPPNVEN